MIFAIFGAPRRTLTPFGIVETNFMWPLVVMAGSAMKSSADLSCQIQFWQVKSRAMFDFMVPTAYLCHGALESKSLPDDIELLVGYLLYESFCIQQDTTSKTVGKILPLKTTRWNYVKNQIFAPKSTHSLRLNCHSTCPLTQRILLSKRQAVSTSEAASK